MSTIPAAVRADVVRALYREADEVDWELMSVREKTAKYAKWVESSTIGAVLTRYLTPEEARVWIKDVPMKEYARAREGIGPFAEYAPRRYAGPDDLVRRALGPGWSVVDGSVGEKPAHCYATDGSRSRYVCWGRPGTFRDLVWAALNKAIEDDEIPLMIVTLREHEGLLSEERRRQTNIAGHCGLEVEHVVRSLIRGTP